MCVLAFAWRAHPDWPLVLAGNRDELHARPTAPMARWADVPQVLGGRDLEGGGTWWGVCEQGRLAVVTNLRGYGPPRPDAPSRGRLARDFLAGDGAFAGFSAGDLAPFNPINLIVASSPTRPAHASIPTGPRPLSAIWRRASMASPTAISTRHGRRPNA